MSRAERSEGRSDITGSSPGAQDAAHSDHSPLTTHHSPLTTHHSPLTTHHSPLLHYRPWRGEFRHSIASVWPIARVSLRMIFRRRLFWALYALGLLMF